MSQRNSGYQRKVNDEYFTPEWVTKALLPHIPTRCRNFLEPACGSGKMMDVLQDIVPEGGQITGSDIEGPISRGWDFLQHDIQDYYYLYDAIITNPPFNLSREFIEKALDMTKETEGFVAMLLRSDYDHAKTRQHLFLNCPQFSKRLVLTKRIVWFEKKGAAPSFNHSWWMWDWKHKGPPTITYDVQP